MDDAIPSAIGGSKDKVLDAAHSVRQKLGKDQPWNIRPSQEWKTKIVGKAQKTGTPGHAQTSYREAIKAAKDEDVEKVFLNRGLKKASGHPIARPNTRPDITVVDKGGKVHQIEVPSKTDRPELLDARMRGAAARLPKEMQGGTIRVDIKKAKE